jgi:dihydrolipoamide dehydrogenase
MMAESYDFDVAVVGSGPAGYVAGIRASQLGARACVIEKGLLGGVCTNVGCIPTKALWHTASTALRLENAAEIGLRVGEVGVDWPALAKRRDKILETLRGGIKGLLSGNKVELVEAEAAFADPHTLQLKGADGRDSLTAARIFIATGSQPVELKNAPFDHKAIIDSSDAVSADDLPDSVLIIGGGYIGLEFANIYTACGCEVTVVEALDRLLPAMDEDCARVVTKMLKKRKVAIHTGKRLEKVESGKGGVRAGLSDGTKLEAQRMLVCVGRRPDAGGLDIAKAGLEAGEKGELPVNEHLQTSQPHIYAIGDVTGRAMLAHVGSHEGVVAAAHATGKISARMDYRVVPACVFVYPEVAVVGMGEEKAKEAAGEIVVKKFPFRALGKAHCIDETEGLVKMICDAATGQVLGVHMCGPDASSLLGEAALAVRLECTAEELAETIHTHPTLPEALHETAEGVIGVPINWRG